MFRNSPHSQFLVPNSPPIPSRRSLTLAARPPRLRTTISLVERPVATQLGRCPRGGRKSRRSAFGVASGYGQLAPPARGFAANWKQQVPLGSSAYFGWAPDLANSIATPHFSSAGNRLAQCGWQSCVALVCHGVARVHVHGRLEESPRLWREGLPVPNDGGKPCVFSSN